ncbi:MAG: VanZ family protein [Rubrivivax sp.]
MSAPTSEKPFRLARLALAIVVPAVAYASLRPFSGWRDNGRAPFAYLAQAVQVGSLFDVALNVAGYVVLAFVLVLALFPRWRGSRAIAFGSIVPALCSVLVEATQNYLPGRTPSAMDVIANSAGALIGALAAVRLTPWLTDHRGGRQWRARWLAPGHLAEAGLVLLVAWWLLPFAQRTLLFGAGDFRGNLQVAVDPRVPGFVYVAVESVRRCRQRRRGGARAAPGARCRTRAAALVRVAAGRRAGAALGGAVLVLEPGRLALAHARGDGRHRARRGGGVDRAAAAAARTALLAIALLVAAVAVVNVAPPDPALWLQGTAPREQNLIGLALVARYTAKAWPFAAIAFLWRPRVAAPGAAAQRRAARARPSPFSAARAAPAPPAARPRWPSRRAPANS